MKAKLGHYRISLELGRGGMGVVYKAYEPALDRYVAIKELSSTLSGDPALVQRFIREAKAMAALNDPHIVQIHFIGADAEQPFFAMELVDGESLSMLIAREGPLPIVDALNLLHQAAKGLSAAHERGVIHRDIKPGNLLVSKRGQLKIADFGIAQSQHDASHRLTMTGDVVGTPGYLSPEVCLGNPVDQRSDLFALGIVLFEMLTGRLPFVEASPLKLMLSVVESALPDVRQLNAQVDIESAAILQRLLAKDPKTRYQSAQELLADLDRHALFSRNTPLTVKIRLPDIVATRESRTPGQAEAHLPATELTPSENRNPASLQKRGSKKIAYLGIAGAIALILGAVAWRTHEPRLGDESIPSTVEKAAASVASTAEDPPQKLPPTTGEARATASAPFEVVASGSAQKSTAPTSPISVAPDSKAKPLVEPISNGAPVEQESATTPREAVEKYAALYLGPHNETVAIARSAEQSAAFVKITGVNHGFDGKVLRVLTRPGGLGNEEYVIQHDNRDYVMFLKLKLRSPAGERYELYLPGIDEEIRMTYDSTQSRALDPIALRDEYLGNTR